MPTRYRAVLRGVENLERPVNCFSDSKQVLRDWAKEVLRKQRAHDEAFVVIFERTELQVQDIDHTAWESKEETEARRKRKEEKDKQEVEHVEHVERDSQ